jgi:hypothetical protein
VGLKGDFEMSGDDLESNRLLSAIPREDVIFTDLDGVEGVLVDLKTKKFYQLNETAILIWRGLEKRMTIDMIVMEMTQVYEVTRDRALSSVESLLRALSTQKLIRPS